MEPTDGHEVLKSRWKRIRSSPWFHLTMALVVMACIHGFLLKPYAVPSGSMEHTLEVGDRIYVNKLAYMSSEPKSGDIIVFNASESWEPTAPNTGLRWVVGEVGDLLGVGPSNQHALVKRVIGVPGDTVSCCSVSGLLQINGDPMEESYIYDDYPFNPGFTDCTSVPRSTRCFNTIEIGQNQYLVMGDHRSNSKDSVIRCRNWTAARRQSASDCAMFTTRENIVGRVVFRTWPLAKIDSF